MADLRILEKTSQGKIRSKVVLVRSEEDQTQKHRQTDRQMNLGGEEGGQSTFDCEVAQCATSSFIEATRLLADLPL